MDHRSVLFGSILTYSLANIACGFTSNVEIYSILRFVAGLGLAEELGAGITLIAEILPKEQRGCGASVVVSVGLAGAMAAFFAVKLTDWRTTYFIGGGMGLVLLALRVNFGIAMFLTTTAEQLGQILGLPKPLLLLIMLCNGIYYLAVFQFLKPEWGVMSAGAII